MVFIVVTIIIYRDQTNEGILNVSNCPTHLEELYKNNTVSDNNRTITDKIR